MLAKSKQLALNPKGASPRPYPKPNPNPDPDPDQVLAKSKQLSALHEGSQALG